MSDVDERDELDESGELVDEQSEASNEHVDPPPTEPPGRGWFARLRPVAVVVAVVFAFLFGLSVAGGDDEDGASAPAGAEDAAIYTCSMHPQIRMPQPGSCPICGMDLILATDGGGGSALESSDAGRVSLSPRAKALAQIRTSPVERTDPTAEIRLLGHVDHDETKLRTVTAWTAGRIDRLHVRVTGEKVRKGQTVAKLYSPEVYAAMRDLAVAKKQADKLAEGKYGSPALARDALESSRERLRLLGVSTKTIEAVESTGEAPDHVKVRSPFSGTVLERKVEEGAYVRAGAPLLSVADLSTVWVQIDAFESDLPHLRLGQKVDIELPAMPEASFTGTVTFIDPVLDMKKRTARVRVEVENPNGDLRPGMFAQAVVASDSGSEAGQLTVPATALLFTGRRSVVYVEVSGADRPTYELRSVRVGPRAGPVYPVLSGLSEGERVVTHGAFRVDADLQLSGGRSMMTLPDDLSRVESEAISVSDEVQGALAGLIDRYVSAQEHLAGDDFEAARKSLGELAERTNAVDVGKDERTKQAWADIASDLAGHARHAAMSSSEADLRQAFEKVSLQMAQMLRRFGNPTDAPLRVAHCPMAFDSKGANWIQSDETLANPYYGAAMLRCGEFKSTIHPGETLASAPDATPSSPSPAGHQH